MSFYSIRPDRERGNGWLILRAFNVPFYVEPAHLLLMLLVYFMFARSGNHADGLLACFVVFISILLHEAGHALACRLTGQRNVSVTLQMFGGLTYHEPTTPGKSLMITLAGPAVTLVLSVLGLVLNIMFGQTLNEGGRVLLGLFTWINFVLLIWNMLPIYPQDGGQTVLHLLNLKLSYPRALRITAQVSLVAAVFAGFYALQLGMIMGLIILFSLVMTNIDILKRTS